MRVFLLLCLLLVGRPLQAGTMPVLHLLKVQIDPYTDPVYNPANVIVVVWKSSWLGTLWSPPKPCCLFSAMRTNSSFYVISPGTYRFYGTAQYYTAATGLKESIPSLTVTNRLTQ